MSNITYRSAKPDDIEKLGTIAYEAFYKVSTDHNFPPDFPDPETGIGLAGMMIARDDVFSVVSDSSLYSSVTLASRSGVRCRNTIAAHLRFW